MLSVYISTTLAMYAGESTSELHIRQILDTTHYCDSIHNCEYHNFYYRDSIFTVVQPYYTALQNLRLSINAKNEDIYCINKPPKDLGFDPAYSYSQNWLLKASQDDL